MKPSSCQLNARSLPTAGLAPKRRSIERRSPSGDDALGYWAECAPHAVTWSPSTSSEIVEWMRSKAITGPGVWA